MDSGKLVQWGLSMEGEKEILPEDLEKENFVTSSPFYRFDYVNQPKDSIFVARISVGRDFCLCASIQGLILFQIYIKIFLIF